MDKKEEEDEVIENAAEMFHKMVIDAGMSLPDFVNLYFLFPILTGIVF